VNQRRDEAARRLGLTRDQADAYYRRGLQAYESGDLENAILDLSEAIHYDRGYAEYYSTRGMFHIEDQNTDAAEVDLNYALKLSKRQWLAHYGLGMMAFNDGDYDEAVKRFIGASVIRPERPEVWYYRAIAEHNQGDDPLAIADMEKAEQLFPKDDKRRKDATAWVKELKKNAAQAPKPTAPPLKTSELPQLKPPAESSSSSELTRP
jgi:Flp pilus assembly protein TadD